METETLLRRKSDSLVRFITKWASVIVSAGLLYGGMNKVIGFQFSPRNEIDLFKKTNDISHDTMKDLIRATDERLKIVDNEHDKEIAVIRECIKGVDAKVGAMIEIQKEVLREIRRR